MSVISFGGLASGLDTGSIIAQLLAVRSQPMYRLQAQNDLYESQQKAVDILKGYCSELMATVQDLDSGSDFGAFTATSANESIFTATASSFASPGSYDITVNALANAQKSISQGFDSLSTPVGTGAVGIVIDGVSTDITIDSENNTLDGLRTAINNSGLAVNASIIYDGNETGGYHLVLTSSETGTDNAFTVLPNLSGGTAPVFSEIETASNAEVIIDTVTVSSQTNSVTSALTGISLNLLSADVGQSTELIISTDGEAIEGKIQSFVDAYNALYNYMEDQKLEGADLRGNSILRSVSSRINMIMTNSLEGMDISMLYQIGIKQSENNLLEFDSTTFNEMLADDYNGVQNLFVSNEVSSGPVYLLGIALDDMTDSVDGIFKYSNDSFNNRIEQNETSIERYQESLDSYEQMLAAKFHAMEQLIAGFNAQGNYLSAFSS
ncbi:MAG: flagellar filament capping protein FliD [bacterium]|nr:flagellar filament capping protein FliD [bacterium]MCP4800717.1 flagellar filament capping protein FliD [bacterium]